MPETVASLTLRLEKLELQVRALEDFKSQIRGGWWAATAAWAGAGFSAMAVFSGIVYGVHSYTTMAATVDQHSKAIATVEARAIAADAKTEAKYEPLRASHDRLRAYVAVLMDRDPRGAPQVPEAIVYTGKIVAVSDREITILEPDPGEPAKRFTLPPGVEIRLDGKLVKVAALRIDSPVSILHVGGRVSRVDVHSGP